MTKQPKSAFRAALIGTAFLFAQAITPVALADVAEHIGEASYHAEEAVKHSGLGHASMIYDAAETALEHAKAALEEDSGNADIKTIVAELEMAMKQAEADNAEMAGKHAKAAFEQIKKVEDAQ